MNKINDTKLETIIQSVLSDLDDDFSPSQIGDKYPHNRILVQEILDTIQATQTTLETISPPQYLLEQTMAKITAQDSLSVTDTARTRYTSLEEVVNPHSSINSKIKINNRMTLNWKILVPVGMVVAIALVMITTPKLRNDISQVSDTTTLATVSTTPATGKIDDVVVAVLSSVGDDESLYANAIQDSELISTDSQAISNFNQSYNENEL